MSDKNAAALRDEKQKMLDQLFSEESAPKATSDAPNANYYRSFVPQIQKRDGTIVAFDFSKIIGAIHKAMVASNEGSLEEAEMVAHKVAGDVVRIANKYKNFLPTVEGLQDEVERQLILSDYVKTAKGYILYRNERARLRAHGIAVPERVKQLAEESAKYFKGDKLGEMVFLMAYSRWIPEEGRRETWIETVDRYMEFMKENIGDKLTTEEYTELREGILNQHALPSMRLMQFAGAPARRCSACAYNCSYIAPTRLEDFPEILYLSASGCGVGFSVESKNIEQLPQIKMQTGEVLETHVVGDSKEGWADALLHGIKTWYGGKDVTFDYSLIRPAGARLKTMGGRASGPEPLRALLDFAREKILARQGKRLRTIDAHDIICKIGDAIVSGGVRRSAMISLSDLDDELMRDAKKGQFYFSDPQRSLANNSAVYETKPSSEEFLDEWLALVKGKSGERGIFNRGGLMKQMPARRLEAWKKKGLIEHGRITGAIGTNPCVSADTWVSTSTGARQVRDLIDTPFEALVDGKAYRASGFWKTGEKELFSVTTRRGFSFKATADHKVLVETYRSRKTHRREWKEVRDLSLNDSVVLHNHREAHWSGAGSRAEGWLLGNLFGDGNIQKNQRANLDFWGETQETMLTRARELLHATVGGRADMQGTLSKTGYARIGSTQLGALALAYGMTNETKLPGDTIERGTSSLFYEGYLQGWFDADGSIQGTHQKGISVRLASSSLSSLYRAQRMLARLGVLATVYPERRARGMRLLPDGRGGMRPYACEADHELVIANANLATFEKRVGFSDPRKAHKLSVALHTYRRVLNRETFSDAIVGIAPAGTEAVYDSTVDEVHAFDANGAYVHNCGEILLQSKQFCNLTVIIAREADTLESLKKKVRLATILGTYQSTLSNFKYLSEDWKKNCEEERLLGVSITGMWDSPEVRKAEVLSALRDYAVEMNSVYAKRFGVNASTCVTSVKPAGQTSQAFNTASGLHARHSPYYIRRVRIGATNPLFRMLKDQGVPFAPEVGQSEESATTFVVEFPVKSPEGATFRNDLSALDQLEFWKKVKLHFTEHNPSVTISVGENEWLDVAHWLYENWEILGGLSFLPRSDHIYRLAPYEEINKEEYERRAEALAHVDFSKLVTYELEDATDLKKELACAGGTCEI